MGTLGFASGSAEAGPLSDESISDASEAHFDTLLGGGGYVLSTPAPHLEPGDATFHSGWTVHRAAPNISGRTREVMTVIWYADGLVARQPTNPAQANDLATWLPGVRPGALAASELNPRIAMGAPGLL
ncbi:MAG: hypothetical protein ABI083_16175 [Lapillicoccus sp.]